MSDKTVVQRNGVGVLGLLGVVFVTLKLLGITAVAAWSWWLVLLPFYFVLAVVASVFLGAVVLALLVAKISKFTK